MVFGVFGLTKQYVYLALPFTGFYLGLFLEHKETERMSRFRDKSALYGRILKEGEKPSW